MDERETRRDRATLGQVIAGVLASFFGVRRREKHEEGIAKATPGQIIVVGLILTALFVFILFMVVRLVIGLTGG